MDSNALIDLGERHYPESLPVFKPIWNHVYKGIRDGSIISVDYVKLEIEDFSAEWRTKFLAVSGEMFKMSQEIEFYYADVISEIENGSQFLNNSHRKRFLNRADPWLIALSKSVGEECCIVTADAKSLSSYGLKPVSKELGVRAINLIEFFAEKKIA